MRVVLQRVSRAEVRIDAQTSGSIDHGFVVLVAFRTGDTVEALRWMADRIVSLRLFPDPPDDRARGERSRGKPSSFSRDLGDVAGDLLVISQFTLYGDTRRGRRPSFSDAAPPELAGPLYEQFVALLRERAPGRVATGEFGALMDVELVNDGPVTLVLDRPSLP
jgi:D-aminoacyl-tRNA deacylase